MNSQINPLRLNETTPNFYGICIIMPRIHFYKKVNFVKNVTYEVLSRQRRYVSAESKWHPAPEVHGLVARPVFTINSTGLGL